MSNNTIKLIRLFSEEVEANGGYKACSMSLTSTRNVSNREEVSFKIGEINELDKNKLIAPTMWGYHYCKYLSEVFQHRPYEMKRRNGSIEKFRYFEVVATGERIKEKIGYEIVTNAICLTKELELEEIIHILEIEKANFVKLICNNIKRRDRKHYKELINTIEKEINLITNKSKFCKID